MESRKYDRVDLTKDIKVKTLGMIPPMEFEGTTQNINMGGLIFEAPKNIETHTKLQLTFTVPPSDTPITLHGTIVYVIGKEEPCDIGVAFLPFDKVLQEALDGYIREKLLEAK